MFSSRHFPTAGIAAAAIAVAATGARAQLTWNPNFNTTGVTAGAIAADGVSMFGNGKANWLDGSAGLTYTGTITAATAVNKALTINSGYINSAQAATLGGSLYLGSTGSLTVTGGTMRFVSANFSTVVNNISNAGASDAAGHPTVSISGGLIRCNSVQDVDVTLSGTGALWLGGNSSVANNASDPIAWTATVNITGEGASLIFTRKANSTVVADHITAASEILVDGVLPVLGGDPAVWEPGDTCVITTIATNQYANFTTVRKQTAAYGSCVNAGACTITYSANCAGAWTQDGSCAGSCTLAGVCTPVTSSTSCISGAYTLAGVCAPTLFQPADAGFEGADLGTVYGNGTTGFAGTAALNSQISTWYEADDFTSQVVFADGTTIPATIHDGGSKWGRLSLPIANTNSGGVWARIGNYDPAHGAYSFAMDVGDRASTTFSSVNVGLVVGNIDPMDNFTVQEQGGTPVAANATTTEAAIVWSSATSTAARTGSISVTLPIAVAAGIPPQAGDALWLYIFNNSAAANAALIDNVAVLGSCCALDASCTMTRQGDCGSPAAWNINTACINGPCIAPTGECCVSGSCFVTTSPDCTNMSGAWSLGGSCSPGPCNAPTGTCCVLGNCSITTQATCTNNSGAWDSTGTSCGTDTCPTQCCTSGSCTFVVPSQCSGISTVGAGACQPTNPCPQSTGICCNTTSGACVLLFGGSCGAGTTSGTGMTCSPGSPSTSCPVLKICCNSLTGECAVLYSIGGACAAGTATGTGATCSATPCPATKICCDSSSGACTVVYSTTACAGIGALVTGSGTSCSAGSPAMCPPVFCCDNTTGACTIRFTTCSAGSTNSSGTTCDPSPCSIVSGACCQTNGICTAMYSADCTALASPGTFLGAGVACSGGLCFGEIEPNSGTADDAANNAMAVLANGDSITGIATGAGFGTGNAAVDFWLVKTAAAAPAIYRHELSQTQGSAAQANSIRGTTQTAGVNTGGGNRLVQTATGTPRTLVWYGFGKQEQVVLEPASGSTIPYVYRLADTAITPTIATGTLVAGDVTIRVINSGATAIDSDTWLYDSNFNAIVSDAAGPGGAEGLLAANDPANTTSSFTRTLAPGTYYLAVSPTNLANDQPNVVSDPITTQPTVGFANSLLCSVMNSANSYTASVQLVDAANTTVNSADLSFPAGSLGLINFVQFTVGGGGPTGVCCRGSTCNTTVAQADCTGSGTAGAFFAASATCNSGTVSNSPCCYADYNKVNGVNVQDIFDFLSGWFAGSPYAKVGSDGTSGALTVQSIFDFLSNWFTGGC